MTLLEIWIRSSREARRSVVAPAGTSAARHHTSRGVRSIDLGKENQRQCPILENNEANAPTAAPFVFDGHSRGVLVHNDKICIYCITGRLNVSSPRRRNEIALNFR